MVKNPEIVMSLAPQKTTLYQVIGNSINQNLNERFVWEHKSNYLSPAGYCRTKKQCSWVRQKDISFDAEERIIISEGAFMPRNF